MKKPKKTTNRVLRPALKMVPVTSPTMMSLLPAGPGLCPICATKHEPQFPHNKDSIHFQYWFYAASSNGGPARWPTWEDAMAHCTPEIQAAWVVELEKRGIQVKAVKPPAPTGRKFDFES